MVKTPMKGDAQRVLYGLIKEHSLDYVGVSNVIQNVFLN